MGKLGNTLCCIKHLNNFYHILKPRELSLLKKNGRCLSRTLANYLLFFVIVDRFFIYAVIRSNFQSKLPAFTSVIPSYFLLAIY